MIYSFMRFARLLPITALLSLPLSGCNGDAGNSNDQMDARDRIFSLHEEVLKPFEWFFSDFDNSEAGFQAQLDYGDPFRVTTLLIRDWLARRDLATTDARIDKVIAKWRLDQPGSKLSYTFAYGQLPAGWWSGMDSWSFPMLLVGLWQETGVARYKEIADRLISIASKDVSQGGVVWRTADGCWLSEYAWDGMTQDDEFYVLNGHLYALQAIRMIANATHDPGLDLLYQCGVRGTKARADQFRIGTDWLRYMLTPSTINQTHYVIFETMQFDALSRLDPDPFFASEADIRRGFLKRYYPVHSRSTPSGTRISMSAIGAPHPYSVDTYALHLRCTDGMRSEEFAIANPTDTATPIWQHAFLDAATALDPEKAKCRVESQYVGMKHFLYEAPVARATGSESGPITIDFSLGALLDAYVTGPRSATIDPERRATQDNEPLSYLDTQGRVVLTPGSVASWQADQFIGIEFNGDSALSTGVTVQSNGAEFFRYYPKTLVGQKALILLSPVGFDGGNAITNLEKLTIFVYTDKQVAPASMASIRLLKFENQVQLFEYFKAESPSFHTE